MPAREQIATLEAALTQQRAAFGDALRRLQTIPGVGPTVASTNLTVFRG